MVETVSSDGLLELHSSDEFTGGFLTTWGELESGQEEEGTEKLEMVLPGQCLDGVTRRTETMTALKF